MIQTCTGNYYKVGSNMGYKMVNAIIIVNQVALEK